MMVIIEHCINLDAILINQLIRDQSSGQLGHGK